LFAKGPKVKKNALTISVKALKINAINIIGLLSVDLIADLR